MKTENLDFSPQIRHSQLLNPPQPPSFRERLFVALDYLWLKYQKRAPSPLERNNALVAYARGYLDTDLDFFLHVVAKGFLDFQEAARPKIALARTLLFLRMEKGKTVPYLYKKLDQDLSLNSRPVFDDGEREILKFTQAQLIEAALVSRKFGIEHEEEGVKAFCEEVLEGSVSLEA